jgi:acetolactate synthase-1/2/3 large subunit
MSGVADFVVDLLAGVGVRRAYTVPGESFLPLLDAFDRHTDIQLISTRHESGASFAAEADAKLTGVPAVAMATRAVGAANLSIGVHTAYQDSTPMIVLLGQVDTAYLGREAFQEVDLPAFYAEITKWSVTANSRERLPELFAKAYQIATSGRPGPVMIALPADLLNGDLHDEAAIQLPWVNKTAAPQLDSDTADEIASILEGASAPVIIAGGGAGAGREELQQVAERYGAVVYASFRRQDVFPNDHPLYAGHLTLGTPPDLLRALADADVALVVGCRLSETTTQTYRFPARGQRVIQIDIDPRSVGAVVEVELGAVADARGALAALAERAPAGRHPRDWTDAHDTYLRLSTPLVDTSVGPLHPTAVMAEIVAAFPPSTILTNDAGNFSVFGHRYWRFNEPRTQVGPTSGAMGYGVPAAVGAKLARPESEVLALVGDGGFLMTGQEVETAVRYGLAMTIVVFRNGLYGTIALHQARKVGRVSAVEIGEVDIAAVAAGYGAAAWTARSVDELRTALVAARASGTVAVIDAVVDQDVLTPADRLGELLARGQE